MNQPNPFPFEDFQDYYDSKKKQQESETFYSTPTMPVYGGKVGRIERPGYTLDELEDDEYFQKRAERFLSSIGEKSDDIFEYLRDSDFNIFSGMQLAMESGDFTDQQKADYKYLREKFNGANMGSFRQYTELFKDGLIDIATDPTTLLAILTIPFTGGGSAATRAAAGEAVKQGLKVAVGENIKLEGRKQIAKAAGINAAIGGAYTTADNHFRQTSQLNTNMRNAYSQSELLGMGLAGAVGGGLLGAGAKALQVRNSSAVAKLVDDEYRDQINNDFIFQRRKDIDKNLLSRFGGSAASILNTLAEFSPTARKLGQTFVDDFQNKILKSFGNLKSKTGYSYAEDLELLRSNFKTLLDTALQPIMTKTGRIPLSNEKNVLKILRGDKGRFSRKEKQAANRLRKFFNKVFEEAEDAGLNINRVENYFPRSWNRKAIQDNKKEFIDELFKDKAFKTPEIKYKTGPKKGQIRVKSKPFTRQQVADAVEDMLNKNNEEFASHSNLLGSPRVLDLNDNKYEKYLTNTLVEVSTDYFLNAARAIQHKKSFLLKKPKRGQTNEEQFVERFVDPIRREIEEKGGTFKPSDKRRIVNLYKSVTGQVDFFDSQILQTIYDGTKLANSMAYLPLATLSSATEVLIPLLKTSPDKASKALLESISAGSHILREETIEQLTKKYPKLSDKQLLKEMRSVWIAMDEQVSDVTNRLAGEGLQTPGLKKGARIFFRSNLLIPWTKTVQATAFVVGKDLIKGNLKKLHALQKKGIDIFADESSYIQKIKSLKGDFFKEFQEDLTQGKIKTLKEELFSLNVDVGQGLRWVARGGKNSGDFYKNDVLRGAARFTNSVILQTGRERAKVPTYMTNPKLDILTQFLRYPYVFSNTVIRNFVKKSLDNPLVGTPQMMAFNLIATNIALETDYWRMNDEYKARRDKYGLTTRDVREAMQRTGMLGPLDAGVRYDDAIQYGQNPYLAAAGTFGGPVVNDMIGMTFYGRGPLEQLIARKVPGYTARHILDDYTIPFTDIKPFEGTRANYDAIKEYAKQFDEDMAYRLDELGIPIFADIVERREFSEGRLVEDVANVSDKPENRIDPFTGLPYAAQSDITIESIAEEEQREMDKQMMRLGFAEGDIVDEPKFKNLKTEDKQESSISQENFRKAAENFKFKLRNELFTQQEGEAGYDYALKQNVSEGERSPFLKRLFKK